MYIGKDRSRDGSIRLNHMGQCREAQHCMATCLQKGIQNVMPKIQSEFYYKKRICNHSPNLLSIGSQMFLL